MKAMYKVVLTFEFVNKVLKRDRVNKSYQLSSVLSFSAVYYALQGGSNF